MSPDSICVKCENPHTECECEMPEYRLVGNKCYRYPTLQGQTVKVVGEVMVAEGVAKVCEVLITKGSLEKGFRVRLMPSELL